MNWKDVYVEESNKKIVDPKTAKAEESEKWERGQPSPTSSWKERTIRQARWFIEEPPNDEER